jgi:hypothetical protein
MRLPIRLEGFANSAVMLALILVLFTSIDIGSDYEKKAYAQENSTAILNEMRTELQNDRLDLSEIKNMTAAEMAILSEINLSSTKLATQGAYTALSVFFLGIALVIFGLRLTTKGIAHMGKYFTLMVWALTIPVIVLIAVFQVGAVTDSTVKLAETEEPFFILSFLMYVPIGIILFLLLQQKKIIRSQAAKPSDQTEKNLIQELERIFALREKGLITDEDYQKLKTELLAKL